MVSKMHGRLYVFKLRYYAQRSLILVIMCTLATFIYRACQYIVISDTQFVQRIAQDVKKKRTWFSGDEIGE